MKTEDFSYSYPEELVAQHPLPERDASRMMVVNRAKGTWNHKTFRDLPEFLRAGDVLVINNSKVFPARLFGKTQSGQNIEVLLTTRYQVPSGHLAQRWQALAQPKKRLQPGTVIEFGTNLTAEVVTTQNGFLQIDLFGSNIAQEIETLGLPPLPPYLHRRRREDYSAEDRTRYQTIYAERSGSAAAPTAGLHFTNEILEQLRQKGIDIVPITLHVSTDTFLPVRTTNIENHPMHGEWMEVSEQTAEVINQAKKEGRRIIAVGTTAVRALESSFNSHGIASGKKQTHLFIYPGYSFQVADGLLTNFHQPQSTLLMLVSAFAGREFILEAYRDAMIQQYRLFSYGDCMLIN